MRPGTLYILGNVLEAVVWVAIVPVRHAYLAVGLMFLAGLLEAAATVVFFAEVQLRVPDEVSGLYYAALTPASDLFVAIGSAAGAVIVASGLWSGSLTVAGLIGLPVLLTMAWYYAPRPVVAEPAPDGLEEPHGAPA